MGTWRRRNLVLRFSLVCSVAVSGCFLTTGSPTTGPPLPTGVRPTPAELTESLDLRRAALESFRGQARLFYEGPDGKVKTSQMIAVGGADKIRIDVMHPFGVSYSFATNGSRLSAYDHTQNTFYDGAATAHNFGRIARVAIEPSTLASLLRGLPPQISAVGEGEVRAGPGAWLWERSLSNGGKVTVGFGPETGFPSTVAFAATPGTVALTAKFSDYELVDGLAVAHRVEVEVGQTETLDLAYSKVWRDLALAPDAFVIEAPEGADSISIERPGEAALMSRRG